MSKFIDETGKRYGRWTVVRQSKKNKWRAAWWLCRCDCGTERILSGGMLRKGDSQSCGCLRHEVCCSSKHQGDTIFTTVYCRMKTQAKYRGHFWGLTKEEVRIVIEQPCAYCNTVPWQARKGRYGHGVYIHNGLDRVDNKRGYEINNVVPCCKICNYAKRTMSVKEFSLWVYHVYLHLVKHVDEIQDYCI